MVLIFALLFAVVQANLLQENAEEHWNEFKILHKKNFTAEEEILHFGIFKENLIKIDAHNLEHDSGKVSFRMKINKFTDLDATEYSRVVNCFQNNYEQDVKKVETFKLKENVTVPDSVNWVLGGAVTGVKDQGVCGSCYAFSAAGAIEGQQFISYQVLIPISEQNLLDCSINLGCRGGTPYNAMAYAALNHGVNYGADYRYWGDKDTQCRYKVELPHAVISNVLGVNYGDEQNLKEAVFAMGPISVGVDANHSSFQNYGSGVYEEPACGTLVNHAMLVVGYGNENGKDYWLVKNSWGDNGFGEAGYIKMARNRQNHCGIASVAYFPVP